MNLSVFDKDTILDLTVNLVPLFIIAFFAVAYLVVNPWGMEDLLITAISHGMLIFTFLSLAGLTYVAAVFIEGTENEAGE